MIRSRFAQKSLKYLAIAIGAGFVLLLLGATLLMMSSNTQFVKNYLSRIMLESRQRTLAIDGDLSWSFSMTPAIDLHIGHVSLSERNATQTFATFDGAQASLHLWPLLSQQIVLERIELIGLKVRLVRHPDGTLNIDDLLASDGHDKPLPKFSIAAARITDGELTWFDEAAARHATLSAIQLDTGRLANATNDTLEFSARLQAPQTNDINIKLQTRYDFDLDLPTPRFTIDQLDAQFSTMIGATRLAGRIDTPIAFDHVTRTLQLEKITGELSLTGTQPPLPPLSFSGNLRGDFMRQTAEGKLTGQFADSRIAADINVMKIAPLSAAVDLDIDRFDADRYLPASTGRRSDTSFDPALLEHLDLRGTLRIGSLHVAGATVHNFRFDIRKAINGSSSGLAITQTPDHAR
jgi:uncharacterized protein involved in outer membrane biogenesis